MSVENAPTNSPDSTSTYEAAVKKLQLENEMQGENFDQARVDAVLGHNAVELSSTAQDVITELTIPQTEQDTSVAIDEAARRQVEMSVLYGKQDLQERASREGWPQEKYDQELAKLEAK